MTEAELRVLLEKHHPGAYGWALRCCQREPEEAEDVLQSVYLKVLGGKARFNGHSSFRTWLFALIRNTAADRRRSLLRRLWREPQSPLASYAASQEQALWRGERAALLRQALAKLAPRQREVLHLVFYEESTIQEAAEILGISVGSARTHYERGKAKLRERLGEVLR